MVLPTPGPPVITSALLPSASRSASPWLGANARSRSAIACSARYSLARKTQGSPPRLSATTSPASSSSPSAPRTRLGSTVSSVLARVSSSATGRPQCPCPVASARAKPIPARTRIIAVGAMPSFCATWSEVR